MTSSRDYLLTINYKDTDPTPDEELEQKIKEIINLRYYIFQLEIGKDETLHHQIYISFSRQKRFSTIKKIFPRAHIERRKGSPEQAREYCSKEDTRVNPPNEWGELPVTERKRTDLTQIYEMIEDGVDMAEIRRSFPSQWIRYSDKLYKLQEEIRSEKYRKVWRDLDVVYLSDGSGVGKTRFVMEHYGYENVYRVTDYQHAWDTYRGEEIVIFEEFRSKIKIEDMLNYLDGYPVSLPSRYNNKTACFTKVFIITNWKLNEQYENIQDQYPSTWKAFLRRINFNGGLERVKEYVIKREQILKDIPF